MAKDAKFSDFKLLTPPAYNTAEYVFFFFINVAIRMAGFCV